MEDAKTDQNQKQVEVDGNSPWPYVAQGRILNAGRGWVWIQSAFSVFMRSPINWMLMALVHLASLILAANVVAFALRSIVSVWAGDNWRFFAHEFPPLAFLAIFAAVLSYPVIASGYIAACRALERGEEIKFRHFIDGLRTKPQALLNGGLTTLFFSIIAAIVTSLLIVIGLFFLWFTNHRGFAVLLWLLACMLSIFPVFMMQLASTPLVLFHELKPDKALKASYLACLRMPGATAVFVTVMMVLLSIALLPFAIGLLAILPIGAIAGYIAYQEIFFDEPLES